MNHSPTRDLQDSHPTFLPTKGKNAWDRLSRVYLRELRLEFESVPVPDARERSTIPDSAVPRDDQDLGFYPLSMECSREPNVSCDRTLW